MLQRTRTATRFPASADWLSVGARGLGGFSVLDRTWYGRVLVERVEGFSTESQWRRAYGEIRSYETMLTGEGVLVLKFWMHLSDDEQERRFERRATDPLKAWKLTDEDWRNRARRPAFPCPIRSSGAHQVGRRPRGPAPTRA